MPPLSPDHNRIVRAWKVLHDNVTRKDRCSGIEDLVTEVGHYVNARNLCGRQSDARDSAACGSYVPKSRKAI